MEAACFFGCIFVDLQIVMMKLRHILLSLALCAGALLLCAPEASAQKLPAAARRAAKQAKKAQEQQQAQGTQTGSTRALMPYFIEDGDTVFYDVVPPVWVIGGAKMKKTDWRQYYRLVYNFNKVYPFAKLASRIVVEADSTIAAGHFNRIQKEKYIVSREQELLDDFEPIIRKMTISQGQLLVRLVDREIGKSPYAIVKDYTNGVTASFWQGIAKLFKQNLKNRYDPEGEDRLTEDLINKWETGEFDFIYFSIFQTMPPRTELPSKYR